MYLNWNTKTITDFSDTTINHLYDEGYVFTRLGHGIMNQTRSLRIDLSKFELSSENKRILKKTENLQLTPYNLTNFNYDWAIGKLAKDFYEKKFGPGVMSANKIKELLTDKEKSNFNRVFVYSLSLRGSETHEAIRDTDRHASLRSSRDDSSVLGYCIAYETNEFIHYSYPFYSIEPNTYNLAPNIGLGMMLKAIVFAKNQGKKYIYLGSASRPTDTYKLQFAGLEWFDGQHWQTDLEQLKTILVQS